MNYMNVIQLLFKIIDTMIEVKKGANIFRHNNLFILFLCAQLLIIVVHIYPLMLSDIDTVEMISHILESQSTSYMFTLAKLNSISHQTHGCRIRMHPIKVFLL